MLPCSLYLLHFSDKKEEIKPRHSQQFLAYGSTFVKEPLICASQSVPACAAHTLAGRPLA